MTARHLHLVPDAASTPAQPSAQSVRAAAIDLSQRYVLELFDALAALVAAHDDPAAAARDIAELQTRALHITGYAFDNALDNARRRYAQ